MIEVRIESIRISLMTPNHVVILREIDGERCLPIFVGKPEGESITFKLNRVDIPRPMSHDLAAEIIEQLDGKISHVLIRELRDSHYFASLVFQGDRGESEVDCRPSDAIAIAVRVSCPIFVSEAVMYEAAVFPPNATAKPASEDMGAFSDFIGSLDLGDFDGDQPPASPGDGGSDGDSDDDKRAL
jgi:bifunctional DNase/RNase